ncbi:hypothetical protein ATO13_19295 [Stappia sp. 22II-S9-Z10]|nr:hypothetical protein ATO13_19295 [Stappia sp. 22II-S9-Z10]
MQSFVRILVVALLAVFAAGSVAHVASTTTMAIKMAFADTGAIDMADCTGCDADDDGDDGVLVCNLVCSAPFVADLRTESAVNMLAVVSMAEPTGLSDFVGRTGPPDPYPPRTLM